MFNLGRDQLWLFLTFFTAFGCPFFLPGFPFQFPEPFFSEILLEFSGLHYCLFVKVRSPSAIASGCSQTRLPTEKEGFEPSRRY